MQIHRPCRTKALTRITGAALMGAVCMIGTAGLAETPSETPAVAQADVAGHFEVLVVNQRLTDFLTLFARHAGIRLDVSERVRGTLRNRYVEGTPPEVLTSLARQFNLDWFEFNGVHYLTARDESTARMIRLGTLSYDTARLALQEAGLISDRFPLRKAANGTAVVMSGPPKLLGISEAVIENVPDLQARIRVRRAGVLSTDPGAFPIAAPQPDAAASTTPEAPSTSSQSDADGSTSDEASK